MNTRTSLVLAAAAATLAVTGCSNTGTTAAPVTGAAPAASATPATTPVPAITTPAAGTATKSSTAPAKPPAGTACPVSEATLLKALRDSEVAQSLAPTDTLTGITCYQDYALGLTHPREADNAEVVFRYTGGAWLAVNGGTANYCDGIVPAAVRPHLKHC